LIALKPQHGHHCDNVWLCVMGIMVSVPDQSLN
jgi:hypothetical protein